MSVSEAVHKKFALNSPISNAADLTPEQWQKVFRTTQVLHGFEIRPHLEDVVRARKPGR